MNDVYSIQKNKLLNILKSIHFIGLTNDSWNSCQNYTYLSITGHYLENFAFRSFALGFKCMTERHRAEDTKEIVPEIFSEYGITERVFGIVTDNNSKVVKSSRLMKQKSVVKKNFEKIMFIYENKVILD